MPSASFQSAGRDSLTVAAVPRIRLLYFVSALCVFQFFWTLRATSLHLIEWLFVAAVLVFANVGFILLYRRGRREQEAAVVSA